MARTTPTEGLLTTNAAPALPRQSLHLFVFARLVELRMLADRCIGKSGETDRADKRDELPPRHST